MYFSELLIGTVIGINIIAFLVVMRDKQKSRRSREVERTPEGLLFFLAAAMGSIGVYVAMQVFRHKTRRWYFQLGIPLLMLQNAVLLYALWELYVVL